MQATAVPAAASGSWNLGTVAVYGATCGIANSAGSVQVHRPDRMPGQHHAGGADHGGAAPEPGLLARHVHLPRRHAPPLRRAFSALLQCLNLGGALKCLCSTLHSDSFMFLRSMCASCDVMQYHGSTPWRMSRPSWLFFVTYSGGSFSITFQAAYLAHPSMALRTPPLAPKSSNRHAHHKLACPESMLLPGHLDSWHCHVPRVHVVQCGSASRDACCVSSFCSRVRHCNDRGPFAGIA